MSHAQPIPANDAPEPEPEPEPSSERSPSSVSGIRLRSSVAPPARASRTRRKRRIAVLDDSRICRAAVTMMLEEAGYEVLAIDSPFSLGRTIAREAPDLVLVDVVMPTLAGDKLVELTLRDPAARGALIVLHSERPEAVLATLARSCGAAGFIRKTSDPRLLVDAIERLLLSAAEPEDQGAREGRGPSSPSMMATNARGSTGRVR